MVKISMRELERIVSMGESISQEDHIIVDYKVCLEERELVDEIGAEMAIRMTLGSLLPLPWEDDAIRERLCGKFLPPSHVGDVSTLSIAIPTDNLNPKTEGIPLLLSIILDTLTYRYGKCLKLLDVHLPSRFIEKFEGPRFGIDGIRKIAKVYDRPLIGVVIKPRWGITPEKCARLIPQIAEGADYIIDDELLVDPPTCPFKKRIELVTSEISKINDKKGKNLFYVANINSDFEDMCVFADFAKDHSVGGIMINLLTNGFSALAALRREKYQLPIISNILGIGSLMASSMSGVDPAVFCRLGRVAGTDALYVGTAKGTLISSREMFLASKTILKRKWGELKPVFPVSSGGINPVNVLHDLKIQGENVMIQAGTGIHTHPSCCKDGVLALKKVVECVMEKINKGVMEDEKLYEEIVELGKKYKYVDSAIDKFG